jgi:hypothetical protein
LADSVVPLGDIPRPAVLSTDEWMLFYLRLRPPRHARPMPGMRYDPAEKKGNTFKLTQYPGKGRRDPNTNPNYYGRACRS